MNKYNNLKPVSSQIDKFIIDSNNLIINLNYTNFGSYSRVYINFLINHTKFVFLFEYLSYINALILKDFDNNSKYIYILININNLLIKMIENNNYDLNKFRTLNADWEPLSDYINYLINLDNYEYFINLKIIGLSTPDKLYVDIMILEDRIANYIKTENKIFLIDINNYFYNLINRFKIYLENKNYKTDKLLKLKKQFLKNNDKNNIILNSIKFLKNKIIDDKDIKNYTSNQNIIKKKEDNNIGIPLITIGSITLLAGLAAKFIL